MPVPPLSHYVSLAPLFLPERFCRLNAQSPPRRTHRRQHADDGHGQHDDRQHHGALALEYVAFDHLFERDRAEQSGRRARAKLVPAGKKGSGIISISATRFRRE